LYRYYVSLQYISTYAIYYSTIQCGLTTVFPHLQRLPIFSLFIAIFYHNFFLLYLNGARQQVCRCCLRRKTVIMIWILVCKPNQNPSSGLENPAEIWQIPIETCFGFEKKSACTFDRIIQLRFPSPNWICDTKNES
jgi:hypothetical protein